jgi:hypothetical protein
MLPQSAKEQDPFRFKARHFKRPEIDTTVYFAKLRNKTFIPFSFRNKSRREAMRLTKQLLNSSTGDGQPYEVSDYENIPSHLLPYSSTERLKPVIHGFNETKPFFVIESKMMSPDDGNSPRTIERNDLQSSYMNS